MADERLFDFPVAGSTQGRIRINARNIVHLSVRERVVDPLQQPPTTAWVFSVALPGVTFDTEVKTQAEALAFLTLWSQRVEDAK